MAQSLTETKRLALHTKLLAICDHVYFMPPKDITLIYPCIVYNEADTIDLFADNLRYNSYLGYTVTVIAKSPTTATTIQDQILELPYTRKQTVFSNENLYHKVLDIYIY